MANASSASRDFLVSPTNTLWPVPKELPIAGGGFSVLVDRQHDCLDVMVAPTFNPRCILDGRRQAQRRKAIVGERLVQALLECDEIMDDALEAALTAWRELA
jgi:hypothetical protein